MWFNFQTLGIHFDAVITWAFYMAALCNISLYVFNLRKSKSLLIASIVMAMSYGWSNSQISEIDFLNTSMYSLWAILDLTTIAFIFILHVVTKSKTEPAILTVYAGLIINTLQLWVMHIDIYVLENREYWWFWTFFSLTINAIDFMMACALVIGLDLFGIKRALKLKFR